MFVTWRRWLKASTAILLVGLSVACSSSSGSSSEPSPTLVTVAPSTFGQGIVCGNFPGAWKTYVATLTDVTDPAKPFLLPSSNPVPCTMPVSFAWVVPGHEYTAEIDGYDRSDLVPYGGFSSGSRHMVDPATGEDATPRWETKCGVDLTLETDAGVPTDGEAGASGSTSGPTTAFLQTNVLVRACAPLQELQPSGAETGILLDLNAVHGNLTCGEDQGQIDRLRVVPEDPSLTPVAGTCDEKFTFAPLDAPRTYRFRVEAFESTDATARWAASCEARTKEGITLPAACDTLSERGALRIDIEALLSKAGRTCAADDVVSYRAVLLGSSLSANELSCNSDASFNALAPSAYQAVVEGFDAAGEAVLDGFCEGAVKAATTTTMACQVK